MEKQIVFRPYDLEIRKANNGNEFLALKGSVSFDEGVITDAREKGVKDFKKYEKTEELVDNEEEDEE